MWKLIRLEYKKNATSKYLIKAAIISILFIAFFFTFTYGGIALESDTGRVEDDMIGLLPVMITAFIDIIFLIYASSMYASFMVGPYKNKTISLMFTYPVNRKKIVFAQIAAVWLFCVAALMLTRGAVFGLLKAADSFLTPDFLLNYSLTDGYFWGTQLYNSVVNVTIALLAAFVGLDRKSTRAAVIVGTGIAIIMNGEIGEFSLRSEGWFGLVLVIITIVRGMIYIQTIEKKDVPDF